MSTYVTALASGPFQCLQTFFVSKLTGNTIPLASWATDEDYQHTAFALDVMKRSLAYFEDLLQIPYPLPKLDLLAVPKFVMGAQENFGLVRLLCVQRPILAYINSLPDHRSLSASFDTTQHQ
jgi:aminopeptidase 2